MADQDEQKTVTVAGVEFTDLGDGWFQRGDIVSKYDHNTLWVVNLADFRPKLDSRTFENG